MVVLVTVFYLTLFLSLCVEANVPDWTELSLDNLSSFCVAVLFVHWGILAGVLYDFPSVPIFFRYLF